MNRTVQVLSIVFMLAVASVVSAQAPVKCGIVEIVGPSEVDPGTPLVFKAKVLETSKSEFNWIVSQGTISKGQGTDEITIDTAGLGGLVITATAEVIGLPAGCNSVASITAGIKPPPPTSGCPFDEYGDIRFEDEQARLDNFAIQIANQPGSSGQILMFAGQRTFKKEAAYRLGRAKSYLVDYRGIDSSRIRIVDCGFAKDLMISLMIVPAGAKFLECKDYIRIPLSEVKFTKPHPKSSKKRR